MTIRTKICFREESRTEIHNGTLKKRDKIVNTEKKIVNKLNGNQNHLNNKYISK